MNDVRFVHATASELSPWIESLRALEHDIEYPIADGADLFRIDHGDRYHPFFTDMGEPHFVLAVDERDRVVANVVGVLREATIAGRTTKAIYAADMKIAPSHRGTGLQSRLFRFALRAMVMTPGGLSWRFAYAAAMRGAKGDVTRTVRGVHPGKLAGVAARLHVYFTPPEMLAAMDLRDRPPSPRASEGIELSASFERRGDGSTKLVSTAGKKDLRLRSTGGASWPLVHLPISPARATPDWCTHLVAAGEAMIQRKMQGPACFALDARLDDHVRWLAARGVEPGAACSVYALSLTLRSRGTRWLHLATSEI